jgi:hypothetical protein
VHSEKLAGTERHLDVAKGHSVRAQDKTDELKQLNRSIFVPVITFNKDKKRAAQEAKLLARYEEEQGEREKAMLDIRETQNRIGRAATYGRAGEDEEGIGRGRIKTEEQLSARKNARGRYQFEATGSDDELENELDDNLDDISQATKNLKMLGLAMGQEIDNQNKRIERIEDKTTALDTRVYSNTMAVRNPTTCFIMLCSTTDKYSSRRSSDRCDIFSVRVCICSSTWNTVATLEGRGHAKIM